MDAIRLIPVMSLAMVLLVGCASPSEPEKDSAPDPDNMTKWGPKLNAKELEAIAKLSTPELVDMLRTGDTLYKYVALKQLTADGGWKKNFDLLLDIAAEGGEMVVEGLVRPVKVSASDEDKRRVDKFLDFLESQLEKDKPSVSHDRVVRSIGKVVLVRRMPFPAPNELEAPYGNARALEIIIRCLNSENLGVRADACRWLGTIGANDLSKADGVCATLKAQLAKEENSSETPKIKARMKETIESSLRGLNRKIYHREKGAARLPGMH